MGGITREVISCGKQVLTYVSREHADLFYHEFPLRSTHWRKKS